MQTSSFKSLETVPFRLSCDLYFNASLRSVNVMSYCQLDSFYSSQHSASSAFKPKGPQNYISHSSLFRHSYGNQGLIQEHSNSTLKSHLKDHPLISLYDCIMKFSVYTSSKASFSLAFLHICLHFLSYIIKKEIVEGVCKGLVFFTSTLLSIILQLIHGR